MNRIQIIQIAKLSILKPATLLVVLLLSGGCLKDLGGEMQNGSKKTEEVILTIANGVDESTRGGSSDLDGFIRIKNMWVLQVGAKDQIIRRIAQGEAVSGTNQYRVKLLDSSGGEKWNIIIVVNNTDPDLTTHVGKSFSKFVTSKYQIETASPTAPIYMTTVTNDLTTVGVAILNGSSDIAIGRYMSPLSVNLLRCVAKVDIGVGTYDPVGNKWSNSGSNKIPFTLTSVELRGTKLKSRLYFNIDRETFDPAANAVKKASTEGQGTQTGNWQYKNVISNLYITNDIYMIESALSGTRYDKDHLTRPRLIICGRYGNDAQDSYYRIDFSGLDGGSKDLFTSDILRNHLYRFTINSVSGPGQSTPDLADETVPAALDFTTAITPWTSDVEENPHQQIGYYMNYDGLNGSITQTPQTGFIPVKTSTWKGRIPNPRFNYNTFYGEADNYWAHLNGDPGQWNGDLYASPNGEVDRPNKIFAALKTEGAYPALMIASNNLVNTNGEILFPWKTGKALTAFDMCRAYNGGGYSDWRLPRLSELALMYANREALEALSGFEPFGNAIYWSGSEYGTGNAMKSSQAWAFSFTASTPFIKAEKSDKHLIRCVRQP